MSTRFFTNAGTNTLFAKLEGVFRHNPDIQKAEYRAHVESGILSFVDDVVSGTNAFLD